MDAVNDSSIETVVIMSSSQVGKSEILLNIIGYYVDQDPSPMLHLQPTLEMGQAFSKDRISPMARDSAALQDKLQDVGARKTGNTIMHKRFPGGHLTICGANSPASLASRPVRIVLADEVDRYPVSAGTEGDPVNLARKRTTTFHNRKIVLTSTPTIKGASRIEMAWESSDQRRYNVPCPKCGELQHLEWKNVEFDKKNPDDATIGCVTCDYNFKESDKPKMLQLGVWIATAESSGIAGFHINELYSPWRRWSDVVRDFLNAKNNPETLKTWVNTSLGETWQEQGDAVDEEGLYARREKYAAKVPNDALVLTAGVDTQDDRLEITIIGWNGVDGAEQSWVIAHEVLWGDPALPDVWQQLDDILLTNYKNENGDLLRIASTTIDSGGHYTQSVYDYVKLRQSRGIYAVKGMAGEGRAIVSAPSRKRSGKNKRPVDLFTVGVDVAKGLILSRLKTTEAGPGYIHFPIELDEEYFKQLTAEKRVTRFHKGFPRREWIATRKRNEALDCMVYAMAALFILNPVWERIAKRAEQSDDDNGEVKKTRPAKKIKRKRGGGYVNGWR